MEDTEEYYTQVNGKAAVFGWSDFLFEYAFHLRVFLEHHW